MSTYILVAPDNRVLCGPQKPGDVCRWREPIPDGDFLLVPSDALRYESEQGVEEGALIHGGKPTEI